MLTSGDVTDSQTWQDPGTAYEVGGNISVHGINGAVTATLTINPGVELLFGTGTQLGIGLGGC